MATADENADRAIAAMVTAAVGAAVIPAQVNWALFAAGLGSGVAAIGMCYGVQLNKSEGWKLAKQFIRAGGFTFTAVNFGSKFIAALLSTSIIGHGGAVALDAVISGTTAFAVGGTAKAYFRGEHDKAELGRIFRESVKAAKAK